MSNSFLRESKLYIEYGGTKYRIYTSSAISLDQTFAEDSYSVKTLHDQSKMFEGSIINKANPASFGFEIPLTIEQDESVIIELLGGLTAGQLNEFNIYLVTTSSTFKLENAIITSASMDFIPENPFMIRIEGEGTKVSRVGDENFTVDDAEGADSAFIALTPPTAIGSTPSNYWTIDGSNQLPSSTRTPLMVYPVITATPSGGSSLNMNNIISVNFQLENDINWTNYTTLHNSLSSNTMFPSAYTVEKRTASGEIRQYQIDNNNSGDNVRQFDDFSTNTNLTITAKNVSGDASFFEVAINPVMYTARMEVADIFTQSYDFRSLDNTNPVDTTQITYS